MTRSETLSCRTVLVAGGATDLGEEVVRQLILARAAVLVLLARCSEGDRFLQIVDDTRLRFVLFDFAAVDDAGGFEDDPSRDAVPDVVVDVLGGWGANVGSSAERPTGRLTRLPNAGPRPAPCSQSVKRRGVFIQVVGGDLDASRGEADSLRLPDATGLQVGE